ncbi:MAG: gamma-glutamyltransferase family protein [Actinomycetota bacterium]
MGHDPDALCDYPFPSARSAVVATDGVVATSQPLAAQAGIGVLAEGGNAVDAAIATAAALTVVEPCSNGLGSDAFAILWDGERLHGLNGSGRWPAGNDADELRAGGRDRVPTRGWTPVTVPGAVDSWAMLHDRFGSVPIARLLEPARRYAEEGFPLSPVVAAQWSMSWPRFTGSDVPGLGDWGGVFGLDGRCPVAGERWASPGHARGLRRLAEAGLRDFYEGQIAEAITAHAAANGGRMAPADLADHRGQWVQPISTRYRDLDVWEIPPNGQGIAALLALGIAARTDVADHPQIDEASWHRQIEAMKLAFADSDGAVGDMEHVDVPVDRLLSSAHLDDRAARITDVAGPAPLGEAVRGGTVYLCTADRDGMMVSFIQSNYMGFGSGVVVPSHGISLQNRGAGFDLAPGHPNEAAPGRRPRHTIIPGFLTRDGAPVGPFGVMGGEMQPQGHLQVVAAMADHGRNPQAALDAPRWQVDRDGTVRVEAETPADVVAGLEARGHRVVVEQSRLSFGRGQIIIRDDRGVYAAGTEPRADGAAVAI